MEWWLPYALMAAALVVTMLSPPPGRRRRDDDDDEPEFEDEPRPAPAEAGFGPLRERSRARSNGAAAAGEAPVRRSIATSYVRDPAVLDDWPQADIVTDVMRAFADRWGADEDKLTSLFRRVESVSGSGEQAFAFVLDPEGRGKETSLLARACLSSAEAERPSRLWVTKYFDHIGERFREDVTKTPQYSRGIITVRDVPPDPNGRGAVALDYTASLSAEDPYDDIRPEDVTQFKNLINIMRMFA